MEQLLIAIYDYRAQADDELHVKKGEIVIVLRRLEDGWVRVKSRTSGMVGLCPGNYFLPFNASPPAATPTTPVTVSSLPSSTRAPVPVVDQEYRSRLPPPPNGVLAPSSPSKSLTSTTSLSRNSSVASSSSRTSVDTLSSSRPESAKPLQESSARPQSRVAGDKTPPLPARTGSARTTESSLNRPPLMAPDDDAAPPINRKSRPAIPSVTYDTLEPVVSVTRKPSGSRFDHLSAESRPSPDSVMYDELPSISPPLPKQLPPINATYNVPLSTAAPSTEYHVLSSVKAGPVVNEYTVPTSNSSSPLDNTYSVLPTKIVTPPVSKYEEPTGYATPKSSVARTMAPLPNQSSQVGGSNNADDESSDDEDEDEDEGDDVVPESLVSGRKPGSVDPPTIPKKGNTFTKKMLKKHEQYKKRQNITEEIVQTEKKYVGHLEEIKKHFLGPLRVTSSKPILPPADVNAIFSNIESLYGVNFAILASLEDRWKGYDAETTIIGDIFAKMAPFLKLYETYCNTHSQASAVLNRCIKENQKFKQFLVSCREKCMQSLDSLLLMPIQRIPRYNLLLEDLLKNTDAMHPDKRNLEDAVKILRKVSFDLNENIRRIEREYKMVNIELMFDKSDHVQIMEQSRTFEIGNSSSSSTTKKRSDTLSVDSLASSTLERARQLRKVYTLADYESDLNIPEDPMEPRAFVKEGVVQFKKEMKSRGEERSLFLFSDLLVISQKKSQDLLKLKERVRLQEAWVDEYPDDATSFLFGTPRMVHTFVCTSAEERKDWVEQIRSGIATQKRLLAKYISKLDMPDNIIEGYIVPARIDYRGLAPTEIAFSKGEVLIVVPGVLGFSTEEVWCQGFNETKQFGWFPAPCVKGCDAEVDIFSFDKRSLNLSEIWKIKSKMLEIKGGFCYERRPGESETDQGFGIKPMQIYNQANEYKSLDVGPDTTAFETIVKYLNKMKLDADPHIMSVYEVSDDGIVYRRLLTSERPYHLRLLWGAHGARIKYVVKEREVTLQSALNSDLDAASSL